MSKHEKNDGTPTNSEWAREGGGAEGWGREERRAPSFPSSRAPPPSLASHPSGPPPFGSTLQPQGHHHSLHFELFPFFLGAQLARSWWTKSVVAEMGKFVGQTCQSGPRPTRPNCGRQPHKEKHEKNKFCSAQCVGAGWFTKKQRKTNGGKSRKPRETDRKKISKCPRTRSNLLCPQSFDLGNFFFPKNFTAFLLRDSSFLFHPPSLPTRIRSPSFPELPLHGKLCVVTTMTRQLMARNV